MPSRSDIARLFAGPPAIAAGEVRAARESVEWTREEMADAVNVLPIEVAAWEAGTLVPTREQAAVLRWSVEAEADHRRAAAAGVPPCAWMDAGGTSVLRLLAGRPGSLTDPVLREEVSTHVRQCPDCLRQAQWRHDHPLPPYPGPSGWMTALGCVVPLLGVPAMAAIALRGSVPALEPFLALFVALAALSAVVEPTRPLAEAHPSAAAWLRGAAVALPVLALALFRGWVGPGAPESWTFAGQTVMLLGIMTWFMAIGRSPGESD